MISRCFIITLSWTEFLCADRITAPPPATGTASSEGTPPPGSPDKLNLMGRPEVAAELDRLAQSASSRSNPPTVSTNVDTTASEC